MSMGTLSQAALDTGGHLHGADRSYADISTDTRTLAPGDLFFALRGDRYNASSFINEALEKGAAGAVVEQVSTVDLSQVEVDDSRRALGVVAHQWRHRFNIPVIGITGSNGKTTIKELTAAILRAAFPASNDDAILATEGNLNNEIGLPLTLLRLRDQHRAAVVEMGASQQGDIAQLGAIADHNIAVISNAARAHLQGFGSVAEVAATKGEILDNLGVTATAVLNHNDRFFSQWVQRAAPAIVQSFGDSPQADFHAENIHLVTKDGQTGFEFELVSPLGSIAVWLPLAGQHNVLNALAAAAAAVAAGADLKAVQAGLANSHNVPGRLRAINLACGAVIYDDSYNANPDSVSAAINFLQTLHGESLLVLGDMGELGSDAEKLHTGVGELARQSGVQLLFCVGELSRSTAQGFGDRARWFASLNDLQEALVPELQSGRNVLIKASRFMGLDQLVRNIATDVDHQPETEA